MLFWIIVAYLWRTCDFFNFKLVTALIFHIPTEILFTILYNLGEQSMILVAVIYSTTGRLGITIRAREVPLRLSYILTHMTCG